jgi:hypothetical protein
VGAEAEVEQEAGAGMVAEAVEAVVAVVAVVVEREVPVAADPEAVVRAEAVVVEVQVAEMAGVEEEGLWRSALGVPPDMYGLREPLSSAVSSLLLRVRPSV